LDAEDWGAGVERRGECAVGSGTLVLAAAVDRGGSLGVSDTVVDERDIFLARNREGDAYPSVAIVRHATSLMVAFAISHPGCGGPRSLMLWGWLVLHDAFAVNWSTPTDK
jgi:hypothetical protein